MFFYLLAIDDYDDRIKFVKLYEIYAQKMQYVAESMLHDKFEAENIVHDTFITIIENLNRIDDNDCHRTWNYIVTILKNKCINVIHKNKKIVYSDNYDIFENTGKSNEDIIIEKESEACLVKLIQELKYPYKEVLYLKYYNDMDIREIAGIINVSYDNVRQILSRGKKKLMKKMKERGFSYE